MRRRDLIVGLSALAAPMVGVHAQPAARPEAAMDDDLLSHFYRDPEPSRLVGLLDRIEKRAQGWNAFPPVAGFFAVVFQRHEDWIDRLVPDHPDSRTAATVAAALRLSGQPAIKQTLQSRLSAAGTDATLRAELAGLPLRLEDLHAVTPTHLDVLWGASFASGDERYVRVVADALAMIANRSELIALDIARVVLAISGGPREILGQLKDKYGEGGTREIVVAATAAWALESNAQQHPFVDQFLTKYIAANSRSPAAKILSALRPRKRA